MALSKADEGLSEVSMREEEAARESPGEETCHRLA